MTTLEDLVDRSREPEPFAEGDNIPWNDPGFSRRMLEEHLTQAHDLASRRLPTIDLQIDWMRANGLPPSGRILDLACGPGLYASRLGGLGYECIGIDFSPASIEYAREHARDSQIAPRYVEGDLRTTVFPEGIDAALLLYGQMNVFRKPEIEDILGRACAALDGEGVLIVEPQRFEAVEGIGSAPATWETHHAGLFSDEPHLLLTESSWDADRRMATQRFHVVDAASGNITTHALTTVAYTSDELTSLMLSAGFTNVTLHGSLAGDDNADPNLLAVVAAKT